ncbi:uncharacterized protein LOC126965310 [Leptidea sinapis]|uniref:uncharacterized protein LOC126965310 n=1 Tax=Leptidea sinapis TaxID=189913 RepID=UPI002120913F|nr:uncharacterized protein LOC126965310 [Leptidea sinapis]
MARSDTAYEYESGATEPSTKKKLRAEIVHKKCVTTYSSQDLNLSETQSTDNDSRRFNKVPKTSAERGREFRARKALLKQQIKQQKEPDARVEIAIENIQNADPSEDNHVPKPLELSIIEKRAKSAEATRRWREKKRAVSGSSKKQAKTAAQRMREYRERRKLKRKLKKEETEAVETSPESSCAAETPRLRILSVPVVNETRPSPDSTEFIDVKPYVPGHCHWYTPVSPPPGDTSPGSPHRTADSPHDFAPEENSSFFQFFRSLHSDYLGLTPSNQRKFKRQCLTYLHELHVEEETEQPGSRCPQQQLNLTSMAPDSEYEIDVKPSIDSNPIQINVSNIVSCVNVHK